MMNCYMECAQLYSDYHGLHDFMLLFFFFFNDTATTEIYTLSLHDALPIFDHRHAGAQLDHHEAGQRHRGDRSEEHTSELQSHSDLVCRLLLEKKKHIHNSRTPCAEQLLTLLLVIALDFLRFSLVFNHTTRH